MTTAAKTLGPRPRHLPLAPVAKPSRRSLPLAEQARPIDQRVRPIYAVWEITLACDLLCRHCGSRAGKARPDELDTAAALDLVDQMAALGVKEVTIIGGEAYLRDDWLEIIARISGHGMACTMTTGGRQLDEEKVQAAKAAGLRAVSVSIDGLAESHDEQRGLKGSHASALRAIQALVKHGVRVTANTQINRRNLHEIEQVYEMLRDAGIKAWQFQLTTAMGRAGDEDNLLLQPWQVLEVVPRMAKLKERGDREGVMFWPGNNVGYFGPHEAALRSRMPGNHRGSCGAGRSTLGIEANGDIKGCPSLPTADYVGGNVRSARLVDIWERSDALRFTRDFEKEQLSGYCAECYYADECRGGCNWTSHVLLGYRGDNPYCHHRALQLLERGEREVIVRAAAAPGDPFDYGRFVIEREPWPEADLRAAESIRDTGFGRFPSE